MCCFCTAGRAGGAGEVAEAFDILQSSGKVRHFGVSNQNPMQIKLLKKFVASPSGKPAAIKASQTPT
jgi:aryl-alcohol dehydrogenase-like predicted oxidoreductase